ncbi:glycosyltransferase family 4 protein [Phocaeicola sp.]
MKIVYLYTALTTVGGADRVITQKANYLADNPDYQVYIITDSQNERPAVFPLSDKVMHIDTNTDFGKQYKYPFLLRAIYYRILMKKYRQSVSKLLKKIQPDIIITTLGREIDFITQIKGQSKIIGEAHTTKVNSRKIQDLLNKGGIHKLAGTIIKRGLEKHIKELDALVVLNHTEKKAWDNLIQAKVIPNSLTFMPKTNSTLSAPKAIFVGRLEQEKGVDRLIEVWEQIIPKHPEWSLDIYGAGTLKEMILQNIKNKELNIQIHDPVSNIEEYYLQSSILLLTSRFEGFGLVLIEAMACGIPCIAYDCPYGPRNIIKDGINGFLIKDGDYNDMIAKSIILIENETLRKEMGKEAALTAQEYAPDNVMQQWEELFKSLTK